MKRFKFTIRGNNYDVNIKDIDDDVAKVEVNGSTYTVNIDMVKKESKTPKLVRQRAYPSSEAEKAKTRPPTAKKGTGNVKAPLPGTILEIKTNPGDEVKLGDTLLIMEAMKMENEIKSTAEGKIKEIKVNTGDSVLEGDVLVEIGD